MIQQTIYVPVDVKERLPECLYSEFEKVLAIDHDGHRRDMFYNKGTNKWYWQPNKHSVTGGAFIKFWLEKQENKIVLDLEEFKQLIVDANFNGQIKGMQEAAASAAYSEKYFNNLSIHLK